MGLPQRSGAAGAYIIEESLLSYWFELKNWLVLRMRPPLRFAPLRGEDKYPRMLMVLGLMENLFDGP